VEYMTLENEEEIILEWRDQMALAGLDAAFFTNAIKDQTEATEEQKNAVEKLTNEYVAGYFPVANQYISNLDYQKKANDELSRSINDVTQKLGIYMTVQQQVNTLSEEQQYWYGALTTAWTDYANAIVSGQAELKDFIKYTLSGLLKAVGEQLIAMAVFYTLTLQWGKAAAAVAAGVAAVAAANAVRNWQQGGIVQAQQGYGGGDIVPAMLEPGEMVIPKEVVRDNTAELNAMVSGQGSATNVINVYLDGKKLQGVITKWTENGQLRIAPRAVR